MLGELIPCGGGESIPLHTDRLIIGRKPNNDICIPERFISGTHCRLDFRDGVWFITDLESRNGITINGQSCSDGRLEPNDIVGISRARYRIVYDSGAKVAGASGVDPFLEQETVDKDSAPAEQGSCWAVADELGTLDPCGGGDPIPLFGNQLTIGRRSSCDVVLNFPTVSGKHCQLEHKDGFWHVRDLNSRNGIRIDGDPTDGGVLLPGSILSVAKMRFEVHYQPPDGAEPPIHNPFARGLLEKAGLRQVPQDRRGEPDDERPRRFDLS